MSIKSLFLETFTWWNNQTLSTKLLTLFRGKFVGKDINGNIFYINKKNKNQRWVIYNGLMDASRIAAENATGTIEAYNPDESKKKEPEMLKKTYKPWNPE